MKIGVVILALLVVSNVSGADEPGSDTGTPSATEKKKETAPKRRVRSRRSTSHVDDPEGTRAKNRNLGDQVITSKYKLNGKPLEVDTD